MIIPVLPELENREQWLDFLRRDRPYAQIRSPRCRVDLQTTYLTLTLFGSNDESPRRYTLGARDTVEPIWKLISGCAWSLSEILDGLQTLNFSTRVRDKPISTWVSELSVRASYPREIGLFTEAGLGPLKIEPQEQDQGQGAIINGLASGFYTVKYPSIDRCTLLSSLVDDPGAWIIEKQQVSLVELKHTDFGEVVLLPRD